ncbi:MAG: hypothetical protein ACE5EM_08770 [Sphingomonadales bacterium]
MENQNRPPRSGTWLTGRGVMGEPRWTARRAAVIVAVLAVLFWIFVASVLDCLVFHTIMC